MSDTVPTPGPTPALAEALRRAQDRIKRIDHDAKNEFHKYRYTSAELIVSECKAALNAEGLSLCPLGCTLDYGPAPQHPTLNRRFLLLHTSGASLEIGTAWPAVPDKGRPQDKAVASAATTSLAYLLRDLLLAPRVDPDDDLAGRDDTKQAAQAPQRQAPPRKPAAPANGTPPAAPAGPPVTAAQVGELRAELARTGRSEDAVYRLLRHNPTPAGLSGLTQEQWQTVMQRVTALPAAAQAAVGAS